MEIEEIQATWSKLSSELEQQKKLTNKIILQMTQERYSNKFSTITRVETIGAIICFACAVYIGLNFLKLDTWYLLICGVFTLAFLLVMPVLVLRSLNKIRNLTISNKTFKETLLDYSKEKKYLLALQRFGIYASFLLMFTTAAVFSKLFNGKDFFMVERDPIVYGVMVLAIAFIFFFSRWGLRSYQNITDSAERILKELDTE